MVVDASVLVTVLTGAQHAAWAETQLWAGRVGKSLWAPHLLDAEVGHALRRRVAVGKLPDDQAAAGLRDLAGLPLRRVVHTGLLDRAWELRQNLSFYDGLYVALSERLELPLLTLDDRLAKATRSVTRLDVVTAPGARA